jgi:hypothetical integral membrane protein (TIGR02206 family)
VRPFLRYGPEHLAAVLVPVLAAVALAALMRRDPSGRIDRAARIGVAVILLAGTVAAMGGGVTLASLDWIDVLPLHLCDLNVLIGAWALLTRKQAAYEVLYYWGLTGTLIATITPDVGAGFPDLGCVAFFGLHGGVVTAALVLTLGSRMRPRPGSVRRVFLFTNAYAAVVGLIDWIFARNYLYLRAKPSQATLLDWLGPWPWYILAADAVALALFLALSLPFRAGGGRRHALSI